MDSLFDLTGKVAIITGASSGLGVQFANALGGQGAKLALVARREEKLERVKAELEEKGYEVYYHTCDVTKTDDVKEAVEAIVEHYGTVDILVNNAGLGIGGPTASISDNEWEVMMNTNINGVFRFAREVGKIMLDKNYGKVINVGSIHSKVALNRSDFTTPYCTTKGAIYMMTKSLASEWAPYNITVNAIGPAYFASEMTEDLITDDGFAPIIEAYCPMGRVGKPGELDGAIIYFASDASSYTTGQLLNVDGGWTAI